MHFLLEGTCQERNVPIDPQPLQLFLSSLATMSNHIHNKQIAMPVTPTQLTNPINYLQMPSMYLPQRDSQTCSWLPSSSDLFCLHLSLSLAIFMELSETRGECCMCGDYGLSEELFQCKVCQFRFQHRSVENSPATCNKMKIKSTGRRNAKNVLFLLVFHHKTSPVIDFAR